MKQAEILEEQIFNLWLQTFHRTEDEMIMGPDQVRARLHFLLSEYDIQLKDQPSSTGSCKQMIISYFERELHGGMITAADLQKRLGKFKLSTIKSELSRLKAQKVVRKAWQSKKLKKTYYAKN